MANELTQPGFDHTVEKLKQEILASGELTREAIDQQTEVIERTVGHGIKAILAGLQQSSGVVKNVVASQTAAQETTQKQTAQHTWLLSNISKTLSSMGTSLTGLYTIAFGSALSDTEKRREEQMAADSLIGILAGLGGSLKDIKTGITKVLGLAANPLGLIGAILGLSIGTIGGLLTTFGSMLRIPQLLKALLSPFEALFHPTSKMGIAIMKVVEGFGSRIASFVRIFGKVSGTILKSIPFVEDLLRFIKPFISFGFKLGGLLSKIALPLTIIISVFEGVMGFIDELKKGGNVFDATLRAIGDVLDFLSFGLFNADMLKKFIGKPIYEFIEGIKELFSEGFSLETLKKIFEPLLKLLVALPNMAVQAVGRLVAWVADVLGFDTFAEKVRTFLKDFDLFGVIKTVLQSVVDFFVAIPLKVGETVFDVGKIIVDMFKKLTDGLFDFIISNLPDWVLPKELEDVKKARKEEKEQAEKIAAVQRELGDATVEEAKAEIQRRKEIVELKEEVETLSRAIVVASRQGNVAVMEYQRNQLRDVGEQLRKLGAAPSLQEGGIIAEQTFARIAETEAEAVIPLSKLDDLVVYPAITSALRMSDQLALNAQLRDKGRNPIMVNTMAAPIINSGSHQSPTAIIAPLSTRNQENVLRRAMDRDFARS